MDVDSKSWEEFNEDIWEIIRNMERVMIDYLERLKIMII